MLVHPPHLNAVDYGWEADEANKCLIPRNMAEGVPHAPEQILKLVKCGCVSERPCKGANCVARGINFLELGSVPVVVVNRACLNAFNMGNTDEAVNQDVDTDNDHDEDVKNDSNDEEDNV